MCASVFFMRTGMKLMKVRRYGKRGDRAKPSFAAVAAEPAVPPTKSPLHFIPERYKGFGLMVQPTYSAIGHHESWYI